MKRIFGWLVLAILIAAGLLWPLAFGSVGASVAADDPVVISDYRADFTVAADGRLNAVETIRGEFPSGRHGLFRYWDVANPNSAPAATSHATTATDVAGTIDSLALRSCTRTRSGFERSYST